MTQPVVPLSMLAGQDRFDAHHAGWSLDTPDMEEPRVFVGRVRFNQTFSTPPVVHLGLVGFDISEHDCARLRVHAVDITTDGFSVRAETWLSTRVFSFDVSWLALGTT